MIERYKIRVISFCCMYCTVLSCFTSIFFWFDAGLLISWGRLLILLVIPVPLLFRSKEKQLEKEKKKGKLPPPLLIGGLAGAGALLGMTASIADGRQDNFRLSCFFFVAAVALCFAGEYLKGRYLLLYCNPSVSAETRRRSGKNVKKYLMRMAAAGAAALVLVLSVIQFEPELPAGQRQKTNTVQQETDRDPDDRSQEEKLREKIRQEEEEKGPNLFFVILRYILFTAIVAMGVVVLALGLYRLLYALLRGRGRRKKVWEFEEASVSERDNEVYTRLVPVVRNEVVFPGGSDGKIRRQFYREVQKGAGKGEIVLSHTPTELKEAYLIDTEKDAVLTKLYEKARYAAESVTEEEIRQWEKLPSGRWRHRPVKREAKE